MKYKCNQDKCDGILHENEAVGFVCDKCEKTLTESEATILFEDGKLLLINEKESDPIEFSLSPNTVAYAVINDPTAYDQLREAASELTGEKVKEIYESNFSQIKEDINLDKVAETIKEMITESEKDIDKELKVILESEELSDDFKTKAHVLFETAVNAKVKTEKELLVSLNEAFITEAINEYKAELAEDVDEYLSYAAKEFIKENEIAIESGRKVQAAEKVIEALYTIMEDNQFVVPEGKEEIVESLEDRMAKLETKLNESINKEIALTKELSEMKKERVFESVADGLTDVQKEKFKGLVEDIEFSEDSYESKLLTIKESFVGKKEVETTLNENVNDTEKNDKSKNFESDLMSRIAQALKTE